MNDDYFRLLFLNYTDIRLNILREEIKELVQLQCELETEAERQERHSHFIQRISSLLTEE